VILGPGARIYDRSVRPERPDIAVPPFAPSTEWVGAEPPAIERLSAAGPILVHFIDFAQLNSVRAVPYAIAWAERYREAGLAVLGVHSPRFAFTADRDVIATGLERLGVRHPVAADLDYAIWHDYGCEGWPSLFLWSRGGALRWFHFGEGEYEATERAIQAELRSTNGARSLPSPMAPLRPSDAPAATVIAPTEELLPGGSIREPWSSTPARPTLEIDYAAGGAFATVDGAGELRVRIDDTDLEPIAIADPGLRELAGHARHEAHRLRVEPTAGVRVWSLSFAAGVPG
jgi:hypothetical protein